MGGQFKKTFLSGLLVSLCVFSGAGDLICSEAVSGKAKVSVVLDKTAYPMGEKILASVKNNARHSIWLDNRCGTPFVYLHFKSTPGWKKFDVHPTKLCSSPIIKLLPQETVIFPLDFIYYRRGGDEPFEPQAGQYKLETGYRSSRQKASNPIFSDEFVVSSLEV